MEEVQSEAERRKVELVVLPTSQAVDELNENPEATCDPSRNLLRRAPRAFSFNTQQSSLHLEERAVAPSTSFLGASFWMSTPPLKYAPSSMEMRWVAMSPVTTADCFRSTRSLA
jgi:hypothetical protein